MRIMAQGGKFCRYNLLGNAARRAAMPASSFEFNHRKTYARHAIRCKYIP